MEELTVSRVRSECDSSNSPFTLTVRKAPFVEEKSVKSPEMPPRSPPARALPGVFNAMRNFSRCNGGITTMSSEVLDYKESPICGGKVGQVT